MKSNTETLISNINKFKMQMIINKNLYAENVIALDTYEKLEVTLLQKINNLSNELEKNY